MFQGNTAQDNGGAISSEAETVGAVGSLNISGPFHYDPTLGGVFPPSLDFIGNQALTGSGGAINTFDNTVINGAYFGSNIGLLKAGNTAAVNAAGGANGTSKLSIGNSYFGSNTSGFGNAIATSAITDIETSTFDRNGDPQSNARIDGGAIAYDIGGNLQNPPNQFNSSLKVNQDYFFGNHAGREGGAISSSVLLSSPGLVSVQVTNSTFYLNQTVGDGGGVDINHTNSGAGTIATTMTNDTFFNNAAGVTGAAGASSGGGISLSNLGNSVREPTPYS